MNPKRLARRLARLCPMYARQGPYGKPGYPERWYPRELIEVNGVRTIRCYGTPRRGGLTIGQLMAVTGALSSSFGPSVSGVYG